MLVKDIVALAAANLGRDDLANSVETTTSPTGELLSLLRCYNLVENELALDYFPLKKEENLYAPLRSVSYLIFSFAPVEINYVRQNGKDIAFTCLPDRLAIEAEGLVTISYTYSPTEKQWSDESSFKGRVSPRLMALGIACEFCLSRGQFSEAAIWQKRYQDALRAAAFRRVKRKMRARRWV